MRMRLEDAFDPQIRHQAMLALVRKTARCEAVVFHSMGTFDGTPCITSLQVEGDASGADINPVDVTLCPPMERSRFVAVGSHELRMLVFNGARSVGCVRALRQLAPFSVDNRRKLQSVASDMPEVLVAAEGDELARVPRVTAELVLRPDASVECASLASSEWLKIPGLRNTLAAALSQSEYVLAPMVVRVVKLNSTSECRYLVRLIRPEPILLAPAAALSPMQREVAHAAAAGATLDEIARSLGIRMETARTHLREAYRRLDVACRLELARALGSLH